MHHQIPVGPQVSDNLSSQKGEGGGFSPNIKITIYKESIENIPNTKG
jgi:hypothetical protein